MNINPSDKIAIISTARKIDVEALEYAKEVLKSWSLQVVESPNLRAEYHQFCGNDEQRRQDLQWAIDNPDIKGVLCFRGGYGTVRILDKIDFSKLKNNPKPIIGYSDVTALHNAVNKIVGIATIHATMPVNFKENTTEALLTLKKAMFGESYSIETPSDKRNRTGTTTGEIVGGNLSILYSLSGTKFDIDTKGKILFIEDLDEYLYHIDRMMWNLKLSGKLSHLKGLIVGGMTDMHDNTIPFGKTAEEIIMEAVQEYDYPVCFNFPAGHLDDNRALVFNQNCSLAVSNEKTVVKF